MRLILIALGAAALATAAQAAGYPEGWVGIDTSPESLRKSAEQHCHLAKTADPELDKILNSGAADRCLGEQQSGRMRLAEIWEAVTEPEARALMLAVIKRNTVEGVVDWSKSLTDFQGEFAALRISRNPPPSRRSNDPPVQTARSSAVNCTSTSTSGRYYSYYNTRCTDGTGAVVSETRCTTRHGTWGPVETKCSSR